ncbi:FAD-binding protein [Phormidesmis priestleyi ULC007]|uniref:FAD-binding protein n=1 Tax=Phormidesmis priestleyi ULC007 TaxID=1920490 RepID=A0A2T1DF06_9CYAN|nr:FAD-dependent monooxygenase [Phormidesmis priestleyi]PSB19021.1 FAD-binding protein [Phormidesmis priestleyi ULC007]PZO54009.1 MAG: FAD-binding protein [Phormidesmis priestleyi]
MVDLTQAVVVGGSIAGLLTARVLTDFFDVVIVVERDRLPAHPESRKGVPQSPQPHVLFTRGYQILEELFPGIGDDLRQTGAIPIDWAREFHYFNEGAWNCRTDQPTHIASFTCSRPLLEWTIRQKLAAFPQVKFVDRHRVVNLLSKNGKITGVELESLPERGRSTIATALVVDASGRGSAAPKWLENAGFKAPSETVVNPFLGYATRRYSAPKNVTFDWKVMLISQQPPDATRLGYLAKIEDGQWIATLGGYGRDFPPINEPGFLEFARSLPSSEFYDAIITAKPVSAIYAHRATANRWRHYEKIKPPDGFVALGDAVCALCPVYGQGMTISALSALVLRDWLARSSRHSADFQRQLAQSNRFPWMLAVGQDSRFLTTEGRSRSNWAENLLSGYVKQLMKQTSSDSETNTLFMEIAHLLKSPAAFYQPKIVWQVIRDWNE